MSLTSRHCLSILSVESLHSQLRSLEKFLWFVFYFTLHPIRILAILVTMIHIYSSTRKFSCVFLKGESNSQLFYNIIAIDTRHVDDWIIFMLVLKTESFTALTAHSLSVYPLVLVCISPLTCFSLTLYFGSYFLSRFLLVFLSVSLIVLKESSDALWILYHVVWVN